MNKIKVNADGTLDVKLVEIWALLSIANDYDQPDNNLEIWWSQKPTFPELACALNITVDKGKGNSQVGRILKGKSVRVGETDYRLEKLEEGKLLEQEY